MRRRRVVLECRVADVLECGAFVVFQLIILPLKATTRVIRSKTARTTLLFILISESTKGCGSLKTCNPLNIGVGFASCVALYLTDKGG